MEGKGKTGLVQKSRAEAVNEVFERFEDQRFIFIVGLVASRFIKATGRPSDPTAIRQYGQNYGHTAIRPYGHISPKYTPTYVILSKLVLI